MTPVLFAVAGGARSESSRRAAMLRRKNSGFSVERTRFDDWSTTVAKPSREALDGGPPRVGGPVRASPARRRGSIAVARTAPGFFPARTQARWPAAARGGAGGDFRSAKRPDPCARSKPAVCIPTTLRRGCRADAQRGLRDAPWC